MTGVGGFNPLWNAGFISNPFRALTDQEWEEIALLPEAVLLALNSRPPAHLQITGEAGRGKSSALRAICGQARLADISSLYEYLPLEASGFESHLRGVALFCLDEAQRLRQEERQRLLQDAVRHGTRLILGTHEDLTLLFERHALPLTTVALEDLSALHRRAVWEDRLTRFARPGTPHATFAPDVHAYLQTRFGTDLRSAERFLYEFFQIRVRTPATISAVALAEMTNA